MVGQAEEEGPDGGEGRGGGRGHSIDDDWHVIFPIIALANAVSIQPTIPLDLLQ